MMKPGYVDKRIGKIILVMFCWIQVSEAFVQFMPNEELVGSSKYIVVAKVQTVSNTDKMMRWGEVTAKVVKNELQVVEMIKGTLALEKPFVLNTFKYDGWMEDNVELPSKGSTVLLFLKKNEKGELKPVGGIQGVWYMKNGEFIRIGSGTTLEKIREMVQKQANSCKSEAFTSLVDMAEIQTEAGHYKEDLEEQMAWLMGEVGDEIEYIKKDGR